KVRGLFSPSETSYINPAISWLAGRAPVVLVFENIGTFRRSLALIAARSLLGCALLLRPSILWAQHHGGHGGASGIPGATNRPTGVDEKDDLKDFHHALAVQATTQ